MAPGLLLMWVSAIFCSSKSFSRLIFGFDANSASNVESSFSKLSRVSGIAGGSAPMISLVVMFPNTFLSNSINNEKYNQFYKFNFIFKRNWKK